MAKGMNLNDVQLIHVLGEPDYDNLGEPTPWSNRPEILKGLTITFLALSWLFVCFRLYVRLRVVRSAGWDDVFVALYLISGSVGSIAFVVSIQYGLGKHMLHLTIGEMNRYLVTFYITNSTLNVAATCIKLSLLFQYLRIFPKGTLTHTFTKVLIVAVACWGFIFSFMAFFPCNTGPNFQIMSPSTKCWAYGSPDHDEFVNTFEAHTIINMIFDLVITLLPFRLYRDKDMTAKQRMGLLALLFMGALVNFLSIWRMQSIVEHQAGYYPTHDPTWYAPISILLGVLEINAASVCASVPIFWPMVAPYLGTIFVTREVSVQVVEYVDVEEGKGHRRQGTEDIAMGPVADLQAAAKRTTTTSPPPPSLAAKDGRVDQWFSDTYASEDELHGTTRRGVHSRVRSDGEVRRKNSVRKWFQI